MIRIPVQLKDTHHSPMIKFGIPLPCGVLQSLNQMSIEVNGVEIETTALITSNWHDKSIKSCSVNVYLPDISINKIEVVINPELISELTPLEDSFVLDITPQSIKLGTQSSEFSYDMAQSCFELSHKKQSVKQLGSFNLKDTLNTDLICSSLHYQIVKKHNLLTQKNSDLDIIIKGHFTNLQTQIACLFTITFSFYKNGELLNIALNIHNPNAAQHNMGLWDLGDPNSFTFNSLNLKLDFIEPQLLLLLTDINIEHKIPINQTMGITQHASGGINWQSPVHMDKTGNVPFKKNGFEVYAQQQIIISGNRATPTLSITNKLQLTQTQFWQNFPSSVIASKDNIIFEFFPAEKDTSYELQGGEKKTHDIWLSTVEGDNLAWVHAQRSVKLPDTWLATTSFAQLTAFVKLPIDWQTLIDNSLNSEQNFFEKRESLDEYGWRNFGDLYADHETAEHTKDDIFVSHYNNQYDPILGFIKQYLLSGDPRWFELADDLTKHVVDIDIYHTDQDKNEYNGGLFWHTDHYLQAYTSSHRSYSKHQPSDAYQDHAGGGGPGGQHCYTTGLAIHHMLTANPASKQAVLTLANWITHVYEGSGTCLELLLALKNRNVDGFKNHFTGQYPLDRGTANYVIALLDSFELTQEHYYLKQAEHIFRNSFHPNEDINQRNLQNVENTWFYTVLLQAICKYLAIKESMQQLDENFYYCRDSLLNFARWMSVYESPYLEKPDILEYPNDTWTAQDLRKVQVFAAAYYYSPTANHVFLDKAKYFEQDVLNRLNSSATKTYTRIMVLVLQNYGFLNIYLNRPETSPYKASNFNWPQAPYANRTLLTSVLWEMLRRLKKLSIKREINWLKKRLN